MQITEESLEFARRHISAFYDTDFFPKPFEFTALWHSWDDVKAYLLRTPLKEVTSSQPKALPWRKARGGYRVVHQLEPLDSLLYTALAYLIADKVESHRMGPEVSCAYRIELTANSFFSRGSGFDTYRTNCERLASIYPYALSTDISDFYNQIYLHRVRGALEEIGAGTAFAKGFEAFLMRLNTRASQGVPVGPAASIIIAEAVLIDVDHFIAHRGLEHVRYVDDFRIFADSEDRLKTVLEELVVYLHQQHRLGLASEKTKIQESGGFLHQELQNAYQREKNDLMQSIEAGNQYGEYQDEGGEPEATDGDLSERLSDALDRAKESGVLDLGVMRAIIRRAKQARNATIALTICEDIEFYLPVINDVALYFDSLKSRDHSDLAAALSAACRRGELESQSAKVWVGWYLARRARFIEATLRDYLRRCEIPIQTTAALAKQNLSWAKEAKQKVASTASWDRRAYLHALSRLSQDERSNCLRALKASVSLTPTDTWVLEWVDKGAPLR